MAHYPILQNQARGLIRVPYAIVAGRGAGSEGIDGALGHGPSGNQQTFQIQVYVDDLKTAIDQLLGVFKYNRDSGRLERTEPARHPFFSWLFCTRITGMHWSCFDGKTDGGDFISSWADYRFVTLTLLFTQLKWRVLDDAALDLHYPPVTATDAAVYRCEWERWVTKVPNSVVEQMVREGSISFKWAEGGGAGEPVVGDPFPSPIGQRLSKNDINLLWCQVPKQRALESSVAATIDRPINLESAMMKVNDATFFGYPAGTLLFKGYAYQNVNESPHDAERFGLPSWEQPLTQDVLLNFEYFDPPAGGATSGHNLAPHTNQKWFKVVDKTTGTQTIYPTAVFEKIFKLPG